MPSFIQSLVNAFFPIHCILCKEKTNQIDYVCENCSEHLPWIATPYFRCGKSSIALPPCFDDSIIPFFYQPPISRMITALKFNQKIIYSRILAQLMITYLKTPKLPEVIIPVPLHRKRLRERGFNQALEIAKPISKYFNIPIDFHSCERIIHTKPQSSLPAKQRSKNIKNAFVVKKKLAVKHIAIVDDVVTTGSTISEFSKTLKNSGVRNIQIWSCARVNF